MILKKILIFYFTIFISSALSFEDRITYDEVVTALEELGATCETPPTRKIIREILLNFEDASMEAKCFRRCLMEKMELHVPNSTQMRPDTALEYLGMLYPERREEFAEILRTCNDRNAHIEDNCNAAHAHAMCMLKEMELNGFEIMKFREEQAEEKAEK